MEYEWNLEKNDLQKQERKVKNIRIITSTILGIIGLAFLVSQISPLVISYFRGLKVIKSENLVVSPVPSSYKREINGNVAYYDPGSNYWNQLIQNAENQGSSTYTTGGVSVDQQAVLVNTEYENSMLINLPSVGIERLNISPNIDSYDERIYNRILKNGLAHFRGTPIPGDGGNSFIYGHSAVEQFFRSNQNNPEVAFSKLEKVEIGDKVEILKDDGSGPKTLSYTVRKKKIVEPTDFSILSPVTNRETVTLMTCWPGGLGTKRLIVIAYRDA